jgi:hypothetical protein
MTGRSPALRPLVKPSGMQYTRGMVIFVGTIIIIGGTAAWRERRFNKEAEAEKTAA